MEKTFSELVSDESINKAKDAYNALVTTYPGSTYEKDAKSVIKNIDREIMKLTAKTTKVNQTEKDKNKVVNTKQKG